MELAQAIHDLQKAVGSMRTSLYSWQHTVYGSAILALSGIVGYLLVEGRPWM